MYLTDPFNDGFTVTDSPGISPDSMLRLPRAERAMFNCFHQYTANVGNCHQFLLKKQAAVFPVDFGKNVGYTVLK